MVHLIVQDTVTLPLAELIDLLRHYWSFVTIVYALALAVSFPVTHFLNGSSIWSLVIAITLLEHFGNDVFQLLSNLQKALLANISAFIRGALWVLVYTHWPSGIRNSDPCPRCWVLLARRQYRGFGSVLLDNQTVAVDSNLAGGDRPTTNFLHDQERFRHLPERSRFCCEANISIAIWFHFFLGLELTGIYFLYWSAANAVSTFVSIAVLQVQRPILIKAHHHGGDSEHQKLADAVSEARHCSRQSHWVQRPDWRSISSCRSLKQPAIGNFLLAFWLIMAGMAVRNVADFGAMALFTARRDGVMTLTNLAVGYWADRRPVALSATHGALWRRDRW